MSAYIWLKAIHVLLAIIAVGFNATYGILLSRAAREPEHELHVLKTVKILDDRFANPAYGFLLITGVAMVLLADIPFSTFWIAAALVLYAMTLILGAFFYTPTLRKQINILETQGSATDEYRRLSKRGTIVGVSAALFVVVIVFLMVMKPTL
jgi:uncharacterized membrane protein